MDRRAWLDAQRVSAEARYDWLVSPTYDHDSPITPIVSGENIRRDGGYHYDPTADRVSRWLGAEGLEIVAEETSHARTHGYLHIVARGQETSERTPVCDRRLKDGQNYPYRLCRFVPTVDCVPTYVVESYLTRSRAEHLGETASIIRRATEELSSSRAPVRYERWEFLPEDELCLHFFEAESAEAVAQALERAGLSCERIVETVSSRA